jgi:hypothetical protein
MAVSKWLQDKTAEKLRKAWELERVLDSFLQVTPWRRDDARYWSAGEDVREALDRASASAARTRRWLSVALQAMDQTKSIEELIAGWYRDWHPSVEEGDAPSNSASVARDLAPLDARGDSWWPVSWLRRPRSEEGPSMAVNAMVIPGDKLRFQHLDCFLVVTSVQIASRGLEQTLVGEFEIRRGLAPELPVEVESGEGVDEAVLFGDGRSGR